MAGDRPRDASRRQGAQSAGRRTPSPLVAKHPALDCRPEMPVAAPVGRGPGVAPLRLGGSPPRPPSPSGSPRPRACPGPHPGKDLGGRPPATQKESHAWERTSLNPCPSLVRMPLDRKTVPLPDRHRSQRLPWLARTPPCERKHLIRIPFNRRVPIWT
jgi:hypothetical protein